MSTFDSQNTDLSSSTISSKDRFGLDDASTRDILVYRVRNGYQITNERDLCKELDKGGISLRLTTKPIPRTKSNLDIVTEDLLFDPEKAQARERRMPIGNFANFRLPTGVKWRRRLFGQFDQLYIVSDNSSKSLASTQGSSGASGDNSPDGPTRSSTADVLQATGR